MYNNRLLALHNCTDMSVYYSEHQHELNAKSDQSEYRSKKTKKCN